MECTVAVTQLTTAPSLDPPGVVAIAVAVVELSVRWKHELRHIRQGATVVRELPLLGSTN